MSEPKYAPPIKLFELLEYCGIRQRDIVTRLGVSKALVSLWRSGHREISPDHYTALLQWATACFLDGVRALVKGVSPPTPDTTQEAFAVFDVWEAKLQAAHAERDPTPVYLRLMIAITMLGATLHHKGEPATWDDDTLEYVEVEAQQIGDMVKALRSQITARKTVATFQAHTTTTLHALLSQLQETPYATAYDRRQCTS